MWLKRNRRDEIFQGQFLYVVQIRLGQNFDFYCELDYSFFLIFQEMQRKIIGFILLWEKIILCENLRNSYIMIFFYLEEIQEVVYCLYIFILKSFLIYYKCFKFLVIWVLFFILFYK